MASTFNEDLANEFRQLRRRNPVIAYVEKDSVLHYVGDVEGKRILDLGCGDGFYCRMLKKKGAALVVGVDISEFMIKMALEDEDKEPVGIQYLVQDARMMNKLGDFDIVLGNLFLCFAGSQTELEAFAIAIYKNLITGGKFVGFNPDLMHTKLSSDIENVTKLSFTKINDIPDGHLIKVDDRSSNPSKYSIKVLLLNSDIYRQSFLKSGFREFAFRPLFLSNETLNSFSNDYWTSLLNDQAFNTVIALK